MDTIVNYDCFTIPTGAIMKTLNITSTIPSTSNARAFICTIGPNTATGDSKNSAIVTHGISHLVNQPGRIYIQYTKVEE